MNFNKKINYMLDFYNKYKEKIFISLLKRNNNTNIIEKIDELQKQIKKIRYKENLKRHEKHKNKNKEIGIKIKEDLKNINKELNEIELSLFDLLCSIPNILEENTSLLKFDTEIFTNDVIFNQNLGMKFDEYIEKYMVKFPGKCVAIDGELALIKEKIIRFLLDSNIKNNFKYISTPTIVNEEILYNSGHFPKFSKSLFKIDDNNYLIPTSETSLMHYIIQKNIKNGLFCSISNCYRNESDSYSKINKRLIRQTQFQKVETFAICEIKNRNLYWNKMIENIKLILKFFNFNYRILQVSPKEMSINSYIQYDFELWFPKSKIFIEISSCSDCDIIQSQKSCYSKETITMNGSALAIDRLIAAYIEYYFNNQSKTFINIFE